jgi:PIN domain nuclease of toxin-antitoxin system
MAVVVEPEGPAVWGTALALVILLDTNALIWMEQGHPRTRLLARGTRRLYISPANLLELQFLVEAGRIRLRGSSVEEVAESGPWVLDDPPAASWFTRALDLSWTRDPFDRLLVAHARLRGWRLATSDTVLLRHLAERDRLDV